MRLIVANCTRQDQVLCFNMPEMKGYRQTSVPALGQAQVGGDLNPPQRQAIIEQLAVYGLVAVDAAERARGKVPWVYDDKIIQPRTIQRIHDRNVRALREEGAERRKAAAVADSNIVDNAVMNAAQDARVGDPRTFTPRRFETTVEEVNQGSFTEQDPFEAGVHVARAEAPQGPGRGRRKAA